jgi:cysteine desulfurase
MKVYFDNAATTPIDPEVFAEMEPFLKSHFGNPSSIHFHGREARSAIEKSRKKVADILNTSPAEIFFTSGGTEADNTAICSTIESYGIEHVVTTKIEHHAVLHTINYLVLKGLVTVTYLDLDKKGNFSYNQLEDVLRKNKNSLVSLMQGNNEIGNLTHLASISELCRTYGAKLHSDTVQTVGHFEHNLNELNIDFIVGSAHKFHGPKGVGFLYINHDLKINPYIHGGAQERNMRGGTENLYGIIGLAKALEIAYSRMNEHKNQIIGLKQRMINGLKEKIPNVTFNGESGQIDQSLYTVLNVCLPPTEDNDMLLFNLDIHEISASGGSACSSGSDIGSHVLRAINHDPKRGAVRFSFSKYNTFEEVDYVVEKVAELYSVNA